MKLILKPAYIRLGDDGYYRICTPMPRGLGREFVWVQGRFHRYEDAQKALCKLNLQKMLWLFGK